MNTPYRNEARAGVTLIELTVVIFVILSIMSATMYFAGNIGEWNKGKRASVALREVYAAQRSCLADNPRKAVSSITSKDLIPYLPSGGTALPVVEDLNGNVLAYDVTKSPPALNETGGGVYDPSGSTKDSLWDVGE
ncbi:MAG: type II secretion system protein [Roseibacillus sp.]|jgi:type II secretory pathway pseudopilin PulG|nr:type II secretion system protein [Roseibacillus sp.]|tara:strand:+ start:12 stop:419 length:408 start_codon:yes stop_codon:yes gene_type:complete